MQKSSSNNVGWVGIGSGHGTVQGSLVDRQKLDIQD